MEAPMSDTEHALLALLASKAEILYGLYDSAQYPALLPALQRYDIQHACLYDGVKSITLGKVAPYLISCRHFAKNPIDFLDSIWQRGVTMLMESNVSIEETKRHLKKNTFLKDAAGVDCYFRYYDARAFSRFIRVAHTEQIKAFIGEIICAIYWIDPESKTIQYLTGEEPQARVLGVRHLIGANLLTPIEHDHD
jgi:hypothetical protein